jgi:SAM-dependent methyltransferase
VDVFLRCWLYLPRRSTRGRMTAMSSALRSVVPELLDELSPTDPRACRSRRDLRRVHRAMGSLRILKDAIERLRLAKRPQRVLELGAGDGSLMLRLAQAINPPWRAVSLTLLDRHDLVSARTREAYQALGWQLTVLREDALDWAVARTAERIDLCITTLFLHHFDTNTLPVILRGIALNADAFVACEPRRDRLAGVGSKLIGLLGVNAVTREDAVKSVAAGFRAQELTAFWPNISQPWMCEEYAALPFTHCFTAVRTECRHV